MPNATVLYASLLLIVLLVPELLVVSRVSPGRGGWSTALLLLLLSDSVTGSADGVRSSLGLRLGLLLAYIASAAAAAGPGTA